MDVAPVNPNVNPKYDDDDDDDDGKVFNLAIL